MAAWSQVFDDGPALDEARRRARGLLVGFALVSGALVSAAPLAAVQGGTHAGATALICGALLCASATFVLVHLSRAHRRMWRFEVSVLGIAATDAAGRRTTLLWRAVDSLDLSDTGLTIAGHTSESRDCTVHVSSTLLEFGAAARLVVAYAYAHHCSLRIDGRLVGDHDVSSLVVERKGSTTTPGGSAESSERAG